MISSENGILFLNNFSSLVKLSDMSELVAGVDFSIESNSFINATILSPAELLLATSLSCEQGDGLLLQIDDFNFKNIVDNIDETQKKILLVKDIMNKNNEILESGNCEVRINSNYIIKLNNLEEGHYLIKPTNQKLIIRKSWVQPFVSFEDLSTKLIDADNLKESRLSRLNKTALKFVYSDLSGFSNYYDIIDDVDLWKLLYYKIECLLSSDYEENNASNERNVACYKYENTLKKYAPKEIFSENENGESTTEIEKNVNYANFSL